MAVVPPNGCESCSRSRAQVLDSLAQSLTDMRSTTAELDTNAFSITIRADDDPTAESIQTVLWILVVLSAIFLGLRLYCKLSYSYTKFRFEDGLLVASWVSALD